MPTEGYLLCGLANNFAIMDLLDSFHDNRARDAFASHNAAWQSRYDGLLAEANAFGDKARKLVAEQDERILKLRAAKKELTAENERLRLRVLEVEKERDKLDYQLTLWKALAR